MMQWHWTKNCGVQVYKLENLNKLDNPTPTVNDPAADDTTPDTIIDEASSSSNNNEQHSSNTSVGGVFREQSCNRKPLTALTR
jgi:hypothetical protein